MEQEFTEWTIRKIPVETKQRIKAYAARRGLKTPEALTELINRVEELEKNAQKA